jgi:hypothetical protein
MDTARPSPPTESQVQFIEQFVRPAIQRYGDGDKTGAADTFFRGVFGEGYRPRMEAGLPGSFERSVEDADAFFR